MGHKEAGKTTLSNRLSGKPFEKYYSTEGVITQYMKSTFDLKDSKTTKWKTVTRNKFVDVDTLHQFVAAEVKEVESEEKLGANEPPERTADESMTLATGHYAAVATGKDVGPEFTASLPDSTTSDKITIDTQTKRSIFDHFIKSQAEDATQEYSISVWDYGGQNEFAATHHLLLNAESISLIVMDITRGFREILCDDDEVSSQLKIPQTPERFLHYWLEILHNKARSKNTKPNIGVILTHIDEIQSPDDIETYKDDILASLKGKQYATYVTDENIFPIDNTKEEDVEFEKLRGHLYEMMTKQRSWGMERPLKWVKLEEDIMKRAKEEDKKFLDLSVVKEMASIYNMDDTDIEAFLKFHHIMGDFIYYPEVPDKVITDPQWIINVLKVLITTHDFIDERTLQQEMRDKLKQGIVSRGTLDILWEGNDVDFLVELLRKLSLIMPLQTTDVGERTYLIPVMLPKVKPEAYYQVTVRNMVKIYNSFHSGVIPIGAFHRLLSKCGNDANWEILHDQLSYTEACFNVCQGIRVALTLQRKEIRVTVWSKEDVQSDQLHLVIPFIRETLNTFFSTLEIKESRTFEVICPHITHAQDCTVRIIAETNPNDRYTTYEPSPRHRCQHGKMTSKDFEWLHLGMDKSPNVPLPHGIQGRKYNYIYIPIFKLVF